MVPADFAPVPAKVYFAKARLILSLPLNWLGMAPIPFVQSLIALFLMAACVAAPDRGEYRRPAETANAMPPDNRRPGNPEGISVTVIGPEAGSGGECGPEPAGSVLSSTERIVALFRFAEAALLEEAGAHDEASHAYLDAMDAAGRSAYIHASAARSLLNGGLTGEAMTAARRAIELNPSEALGYQVLARAHLARRETAEAIEQFEKVLEIQPDSLDTLAELGNLYLSEDMGGKAVAVFRRIMELLPHQAHVYRMQVAHLLFRMERYDEALEEYRALAKIVPDSAEVHLRTGAILQARGEVDGAIESYLNALNHLYSPEQEAPVRRLLGELYESRGSNTEAIFQYTRIKELDPDDTQSRTSLAYLLMEEGRDAEALEEVRALLERDPDDYSLQRMRFDLLAAAGREAEAHQGFLRALERAVTFENAANINAFLWDLFRDETLRKIEMFHQLDYLRAQLARAEDALPRLVRPAFAWTKLELFQNNGAGAENRLRGIVSALETALGEGDADRAETIGSELLNWQSVRLEFGKRPAGDGLEAALSDCARKWPETPWPLRALAALRLDERDWAGAEPLLSKALSLAGEGGGRREILFQLAWTREQLGRPGGVERLMREAMELDPDDPEPYNYLGYMLADRNTRLNEALTLIEKAVRLDPDNGNFLDSLGWVYFRLGRLDEAARILRSALEFEPGHPVIHDHLGDVLFEMGMVDEAIAQWREALRGAPGYPLEFGAEGIAEINAKIHEAEVRLKS